MDSIADIYRRTRKVPDLPWNTYVCRPLAAVLVYGLRNTAVTPNQVTLGSFAVTGVAVLLLASLRGHGGLLASVLVYELSYVLDCADGMLARLRGIQSTPGHLLDFLMDEIKAYAVLAAVAIRLYREDGSADFLLLGLGGVVALASGIGLTTFQRRPEIVLPVVPGSARASTGIGRVVRPVESVARLLIHYPSYIWLAALLGHIEWYFYPYIAVNALYAVRAFAAVALRFGRS